MKDTENQIHFTWLRNIDESMSTDLIDVCWWKSRWNNNQIIQYASESVILSIASWCNSCSDILSTAYRSLITSIIFDQTIDSGLDSNMSLGATSLLESKTLLMCLRTRRTTSLESTSVNVEIIYFSVDTNSIWPKVWLNKINWKY